MKKLNLNAEFIAKSITMREKHGVREIVMNGNTVQDEEEKTVLRVAYQGDDGERR